MLTGDLKAICIKELQTYVAAFQERRAKVTDETVQQFMAIRPLEWRGNRAAPIVVPQVQDAAAEGGEQQGDGKLTKNQLKKLEKQKQIEAKKAQQAKEKADKAQKAQEEAPAAN